MRTFTIVRSLYKVESADRIRIRGYNMGHLQGKITQLRLTPRDPSDHICDASSVDRMIDDTTQSTLDDIYRNAQQRGYFTDLVEITIAGQRMKQLLVCDSEYCTLYHAGKSTSVKTSPRCDFDELINSYNATFTE